jgi:phosphatidylglycerol:prolipoprotein diacylglycerol transferase
MYTHTLNPELPFSPFIIPVWLISILLVLLAVGYSYFLYKKKGTVLFQQLKSDTSLQMNYGTLLVLFIASVIYASKSISLHVRWYGVIYAVGFAFIFMYLSYLARTKAIEHFETTDVEPFLIGLIISMVIGARLFHVFVYETMYYLLHPLEIVMVWNGGLSFHGALLFMGMWIFYFCKKKKIEVLRLTDYLVVPAALFLSLGRMANFINGELVGKITNVSWGVKFPLYDGFRHPTQIYESVKNLILFGILFGTQLAQGHIFRKYVPGLLTIIFLIGYGSLRFFIEFLKDFESIFIGLNMGQILSLFVVFLGIYLIFIIRKTHVKFKKMNN